MKKQTNKKKGVSTGTVVAIGAGVAAVAAASYYFFGPEGKKNRAAVRGWMIKMKGEIVEKLEETQDVTESLYHHIVDAVAAKYAKSTKIGAEEVIAFANILKKQWKGIAAMIHADKKRVHTAKKAVKKSAKKVAKKSSPHKAKKVTT